LVVRALPPDKTPGLDGFTAGFLQSAYPIIKGDIMAAFDALWHMDLRNFHDLNGALLVLIPTTAEASSIRDYRPISFTHLLGKLFSKVLVNRLAPWLHELVHCSQSAFIKG
jgi:hypothetical protein